MPLSSLPRFGRGNDLSIPASLQDFGSWSIDILRFIKLEVGWGGGGELGAECVGGIVTNRIPSPY